MQPSNILTLVMMLFCGIIWVFVVKVLGLW